MPTLMSSNHSAFVKKNLATLRAGADPAAFFYAECDGDYTMLHVANPKAGARPAQAKPDFIAKLLKKYKGTDPPAPLSVSGGWVQMMGEEMVFEPVVNKGVKATLIKLKAAGTDAKLGLKNLAIGQLPERGMEPDEGGGEDFEEEDGPEVEEPQPKPDPLQQAKLDRPPDPLETTSDLVELDRQKAEKQARMGKVKILKDAAASPDALAAALTAQAAELNLPQEQITALVSTMPPLELERLRVAMAERINSNLEKMSARFPPDTSPEERKRLLALLKAGMVAARPDMALADKLATAAAAIQAEKAKEEAGKVAVASHKPAVDKAVEALFAALVGGADLRDDLAVEVAELSNRVGAERVDASLAAAGLDAQVAKMAPLLRAELEKLAIKVAAGVDGGLDPTAWAEAFAKTLSAKKKDAINAAMSTLLKDARALSDAVDFDQANCRKELIERGGWVGVKAHYLKKHPDTQAMWQFVLFRKRVVNNLLTALRNDAAFKAAIILTKSVGSVNISSDYDLTISAVEDPSRVVPYIKAFNEKVRSLYGMEPGVAFDTNLYAKDFLMVKDTLDDSLKGLADEGHVEKVVGVLKTMDKGDQDIAALTKVRRYMSRAEWDDYARQLGTRSPEEEARVAALPEEERKKANDLFEARKKQLEETDSRYARKVAALAAKALPEYKKWRSAQPEADEHLQELDELAQFIDLKKVAADSSPDPAARQVALAQYQNALEDFVNRLKHVQGNIFLQASNDVYLEEAGRIREVQKGQAAAVKLLDANDTARLEKKLRAELTGKVPEGAIAAVLKAKSEEWIRKKHAAEGIPFEEERLKKLAELQAELGPPEPLELTDAQLDTLDGLDGLEGKARADRVAQTTKARSVLKEALAKEPDPLKRAEIARKWLAEREQALREQARNQLGEANFFAAEAYHAEGPLTHVVFGNQGGNADAIKSIDADQLLQSFNEQVGDFLKDVGEYGADPAGLYQTAKYFGRMLEAVKELKGRPGMAIAGLPAWAADDAMKASLAELMKIRGSKGEYATRTAEEKGQKAAEILAAHFGGGVKLAGIKSEVTKLSVLVNDVVRKAIALRADTDATKSYFAHADVGKAS